MKRNRRYLVIAMLLALLAAAGAWAAGTKEGAAASSKAESFNPSVFPISKEKITLKMVAGKSPDHGDFDKMKIVNDFEKKSNIHVEWTAIPYAGYEEKKNLLLASGDLPDAFYGRGMLPKDDLMYGPLGVFMPLNDLIAKYAPNVMKAFTELPHIKASMTTPDGKIYDLPAILSLRWNDAKHYINVKWLAKLKLAMPTTVEEYYQVLKAFKSKDPNGNGKADEIPFSNWASYYGFGPLYGSWGAADYWPNHMTSKNGKLLFASIQPGYRDGLKEFNKWWNEGLIDQETFTQKNEELSAKGKNPEVLLGSFIRHISDYVVGSNRYFDYDSIPPLKGPAGLQGWTPPGADFRRGHFVITNKNKYPRESIRWIDYQYTEQGSLEFNFGPENVTWKWLPDGRWESILPPAGVGLNDWRNGNSFGGYSGTWQSQRLADKQAISDPIGLNRPKEYAPYIPFFPNEYFPDVYFTTAQQEKVQELQGRIFSYVKQMEAKFISSQASIEKDWDEYLKTLDQMKLTDLMKVYQEAYDVYLKNK